MNREAIESIVKHTVCEISGYNNVLLEQRLEEDLGLESLDRIELSMALEEDFELSIPVEDSDALLTVRQIVDYIESHKDCV